MRSATTTLILCLTCVMVQLMHAAYLPPLTEKSSTSKTGERKFPVKKPATDPAADSSVELDLDTGDAANGVTTGVNESSAESRQSKQKAVESGPNEIDAATPSMSSRKDKMLGYFGYYPFAQPIPQPAFYPTDYYDQHDFGGGGGGIVDETDDDDNGGEALARTNIQRRRPGGHTQRQHAYSENSPIYYIRLPPTPYIFVPGLGYISQPPTLTPMTQMQPMQSMQPMPANPISPFINLPLSFMTNGKPSAVYQWSSSPSQIAIPMPPQQRPISRPYNLKPAYMPDSKITHLKRPFLFNGRPNEIFLLQNAFNSIYSDPMSSYY